MRAVGVSSRMPYPYWDMEKSQEPRGITPEPPDESGADDDNRQLIVPPEILSTHEEKAESEPISQSFEYRDVSGVITGRAEIRLSGTITKLNDFKREKAHGRALESFVLSGTKNGEPVMLDLLAMANQHKVTVFISETRLSNYLYNEKADRSKDGKEVKKLKYAIAPLPETAADVAVLLHELGHADQYQEEDFRRLTNARRKDYDPQTVLDALEAATDHFDVADQLWRDEGLVEVQKAVVSLHNATLRLEVAESRLDDARKTLVSDNGSEPARKRLGKAEADEKRLSLERQEAHDVATRALQIAMTGINAVAAVARLPERMIERNATKRAFNWMRDIKKKIGTDFLSSPGLQTDETDTGISGLICRDETAEPGEAGGQDFLKGALETYGAERSTRRNLQELKRKMGDDPERLAAVRRVIKTIGQGDAGEKARIGETDILHIRAELDALRNEIIALSGLDPESKGLNGLFTKLRLNLLAQRDTEIGYRIRRWQLQSDVLKQEIKKTAGHHEEIASRKPSKR